MLVAGYLYLFGPPEGHLRICARVAVLEGARLVGERLLPRIELLGRASELAGKSLM